MNYVDHPIEADLWGGEAKLTIMNGKDGLMKVQYKPRANKAYSHDLNNVETSESTSLLDVPIKTMHGNLDVVKFVAVSTFKPILTKAENLGSIKATPCDIVAKY